MRVSPVLVDGPATHGHLALMSRPFIFPYLAQLAANMSGRRMIAVSYLIVAAGLIALMILTVDPAYEAAHRWVEAALWACLAFFAFEWLARLVRAIRAPRGWTYAVSGGGLVAATAAMPGPVPLAPAAPLRPGGLLGGFRLPQ